MTTAEITTAQLGSHSIEEITNPGERYNAITYVQLFGFSGIEVWRSPYDRRVRARYTNPDWQLSDEYRAYVRAANTFA